MGNFIGSTVNDLAATAVGNSEKMQGYEPLGIGVGTLLGGRYNIVQKLGSGGMSAVYEAQDRSLDNSIVAVKLLSPKMTNDETILSRFRQEIIITRKLTHPNIVRTYDFGAAGNGHFYITMELISGTTLDKLLSQRKALSLKHTLFVIRSILNAMAYAHDKGVVHRDLKPGNVLVSENNEIKLMDFGLAQSIDFEKRYTQTGECVGTPYYMAPEQIQGRPIDQRADIFSIGVMAYELLTGSVPFKDESWYDLATKILKDPMPRVSEKIPDVPEWLDNLITKATQKNKEDRYQSVDEMLAVLQNYVKPDSNYAELFRTKPNIQLFEIEELEEDSVSKPIPRFLVDPTHLAPFMFVISVVMFFSVLFYEFSKVRAPKVEHSVKTFSNEVHRLSKSLKSSAELIQVLSANQENIEALVEKQKNTQEEIKEIAESYSKHAEPEFKLTPVKETK